MEDFKVLIQSRSVNNVIDLTQFVDRLNFPFNREKRNLYQAVLEHLPDGILILTKTGQRVYANSAAQDVCAQLSASTTDSDYTPKEIWQVCQTLFNQRFVLAHYPALSMSEVQVEPSRALEVWVQWLKLPDEDAYLLVTLKDRLQSIRNLAALEAKHYGLTAREAEAWLLRRVGYNYQDIAAQLYISVNTVKKHLKSGYAKQRAHLDWDE
jgi:DNA-binding CsgD family transcriptional regulator